MNVTVQRESVEKIQCVVSATANPTSGALDWSFTTNGARPSVWTSGTWGTASSINGSWQATAISPVVGAGGLDLVVGLYAVWVRVTTGSETPVMQAGQLNVA